MAQPRLKEKYLKEVCPAIQQKFELKNVMELPRLKKITVNMGLGEFGKDAKMMAAAVEDLGRITGQRPVKRNAKVAVATFKLREHDPVGCSVTLRGDRMWHFLEKFISVACPRIRDFNGLKHGFDRRGNYTCGLQDQLIFPEIRPEKVARQQGMDVCLTITGGSDAMSKELLLGLGFPLKRDGDKRKD